MAQILDMTTIRYLNLFEKITGVRTKNCFVFNRQLIFAVPFPLISRAIGENGANVKKIVPIVGKRIKIVAIPRDNRDVKKFISDVVSPINVEELQVTDEDIIITGSRDSKAALIGRDKVRLIELDKIVKEVFNKNLKIV